MRPILATLAAALAYRRALSVLVGNGPFLAIHPTAMLTTPNAHPQLTAIDVRLPTTRGPIGLITLKGRSLSPAAKIFLQSAASVAKAIPPGRPQHRARRRAT